MADPYIDYFECDEYGGHFLNEGPRLIGASPLVDIAALLAYVKTHTDAVSAELQKQGISKSATRIDRQDVEAKTLELRTCLGKFYSYLASLDEGMVGDVHAFFEGGNKGSLTELKPADLAARVNKALSGFEVSANASLPNAGAWKTKLEAAEQALMNALTGKSTTSVDSVKATSDLIAARKAFLVAYNRVAKPLVRAVLVLLGREGEMPLFFKDMAVNEGSRAKKAADEPAAPG